MSERMGIWVSWEICTRKRKKHDLGVFSGDGEIPSSELKIRHQKNVNRFAQANFGKTLGEIHGCVKDMIRLATNQIGESLVQKERDVKSWELVWEIWTDWQKFAKGPTQ